MKGATVAPTAFEFFVQGNVGRSSELPRDFATTLNAVEAGAVKPGAVKQGVVELSSAAAENLLSGLLGLS